MAVNFPENPTLYQIFVNENETFIWNGSVWATEWDGSQWVEKTTSIGGEETQVLYNGPTGITGSSYFTFDDFNGVLSVIGGVDTYNINSVIVNTNYLNVNTEIWIGSSKINATSYSGTANNSLYLGGQLPSYYLANSSYTPSDVLSKLLNVDGSGSGLDSDLLDGYDSTAFARLATSPTFTGGTVTSQTTEGGNAFSAISSNGGIYLRPDGDNGNVFRWGGAGTSASILKFLTVSDTERARFNSNGSFAVINGLITANSNIVWHAGNDGAGSGLDADTVDGIQASSFGLLSGSDYTFVRSYNANNSPSNSLGIVAGRNSTQYLNLHGHSSGNFVSSLSDSAAPKNLVLQNSQDSGVTFKQLILGATDLSWDGGKVWTASNDGAGSGLDADTIDGLNSTVFIRNDTTGTQNLQSDLLIGLGNASGLEGGQINFAKAPSGTSTSNPYIDVYGDNFRMVALPGGVTKILTFPFDTGTIWHSGNDGAGSGLDADTIDGYNVGTSGSSIPLLNTVNTWSANQATSSDLFVGNVRLPYTGTNEILLYKSAAGEYTISTNRHIGGSEKYFTFSNTGTLSINGSNVWTAGNDGAGSGLDADTLDGLNSTAFAQLSGAAFTGGITATGLTTTGTIVVNDGSGLDSVSLTNDGAIELFKTGGAYIDFKNATGDDYDVRIQQTGSNGLAILANDGLSVRNSSAVWVGVGLDQMNANSSVQGNAYIDFRNENVIATSSVHGHTHTDGSGWLDFSATPTGSRTADRRFSVAYMDQSGFLLNNGNIRTSGVDGMGLAFWNDNSYKIYMSSQGNSTWGGRMVGDTLSDYNMYFRMTGGNRGYVFQYGTNNVFGIDYSGVARAASSIKARTHFELSNGTASTWYNVMFRNDGSTFYMLSSDVQTTQAAAINATWNNFRPFQWNLATGGVNINSGGHGGTFISGSTAWHAGNDGAGSGLDADVLDGYNSSAFARWAESNTFTGKIYHTASVTGNSGMNNATGGLGELEIQGNGTGASMMTFHRPGSFAAYFGLHTDNTWRVGGWSMGAAAYRLWHEGNDGSGSGLDADVLDGYDSSSFLRLYALGQWQSTSDGTNRFWFESGGRTYYKSGNGHEFRNSSDAGSFFINNDHYAYFTGTLKVSTNNATGGGLQISDDGDIVDLNDGYCSMRFGNGVKIYSANAGGFERHAFINNGDCWHYDGSNMRQAWHARAWVNFNGSGTVAIRSSGNISSITDNGIGRYTVNFSNSLPDTNYAAVGSSTVTTTGQTNMRQGTHPVFRDYATTSIGVYPMDVTTSDNFQDAVIVNVAIFR